MSLITRPGIYLDMPVADYFADPCPQPSLTQSVAKILLDRSPLHAWYAHPRLNPDFVGDDATKYDVGNIAHALLLGRGRRLVVIEAYSDWRKEAARTLRTEAFAEGKLAVLGRDYAKAWRMVEAARAALERCGLPLFTAPGGAAEAVLAWEEDGAWLRQMVDWVWPGGVADYKTTEESAAPHGIARKMAADGWHIQAAMAERGLAAVNPTRVAGRDRFHFVVQEVTPPYALTVVEIGEGALTMGRKMLDHAVAVWKACLLRNRWPAYPDDCVCPDFPGWAEQAWLDREIAAAAAARHPVNVLDAG